MTYQTRREVVMMATEIVVIGIYLFYLFGTGRYLELGNDLSEWAKVMLVFIGIRLASIIVIQIIYHIAQAIGTAVTMRDRTEEEIEAEVKNSTSSDDEMDKLIELKANYYASFVLGVGVLAALVGLVLGMEYFVMLNLVFLSGWLVSVGENVLKLYFYQFGVKNG